MPLLQTTLFSCELVISTFAADGLKCWSVTADGGDGFAIEPDKCSGSEAVSSIGINGEPSFFIAFVFHLCFYSHLFNTSENNCTCLVHSVILHAVLDIPLLQKVSIPERFFS